MPGQAPATVRLGHEQRGPPEPGGLAPPVALEPVGGVPQGADAGERCLAVEKTSRRLAEKLLVLGELEVHGSPFRLCAAQAIRGKLRACIPGQSHNTLRTAPRSSWGQRRRITYRELDERSQPPRPAVRASAGLGFGDHVAFFLENHAALPRDPLGRAALRPLLHRDQLAPHRRRGRLHRRRLRRAGPHHVARARRRRRASCSTQVAGVETRLMVDGVDRRLRRLRGRGRRRSPTTPIADELEGDAMLYSSGTTGRPKGIRVPPRAPPDRRAAPTPVDLLQGGVRDRRRRRLPLARAAVPLGAAAVLDDAHPRSAAPSW